MKRVVVVSGACGAGKSAALRSMRKAVAGRVGEIAVLEADQFYMMIDPHWEMPPDRVDRYFEVTGWLTRETARGFLRLGFDLVVVASNGFWAQANVREFVEPFGSDGAAAHHVTLDPGLEVVCQRLSRRYTEQGAVADAAEIRASAAAELTRNREHYGKWTQVIDNAALTPHQTASAILDAVESGAGCLD